MNIKISSRLSLMKLKTITRFNMKYSAYISKC